MKQFASEISEEVLKNVAQDVLDRARLCLQVNGGHFQQLMRRGSKRYNALICDKIIENPLQRNSLVYRYPLFFLLRLFNRRFKKYTYLGTHCIYRKLRLPY